MKNISILILIISLFCFSGCSSNNNTQNESSSQNTTNASNTNNKSANNSDSAKTNIGNGIGNAVDSAGNLVGNVIDDAGTAIADIGNNVESIVNGDSNTDNRDTSNMELTKNSQNQVTNIKSTNNSNAKTTNVSSSLSQCATQIAKDINSIDGVEKATVIITGETALIGLNLSNNLNDEQISNIKRLAEAKGKSSNTGIKNSSVTASPELVQRITNLANDIKEGKPISGLTQELGDLIKRVTPTI